MSDPTDPNDTDDRAWFRAQVDPVVEAEPIADAWTTISARTDGAPVPVAHSATGPSSKRWLGAAAVLVLLAGIAVTIAVNRDDSRSVTAGPSSEPTGWYIPVGLPDGWRLASAFVTAGSPCDGVSQRWKTLPEEAETDGARPAVELAYTSCGALPDAAGEPGPPLGPRSLASFVGPSKEDPSFEVVRWQDDGLWELTGEGITGDRLLEAAQAVAAHPGSVESPLPGFGSTSTGAGQDADPEGAPSVALALTTPSGAQVHYQLVVSGDGPPMTPFTSDDDHPVAAQPLSLRRRGSIPLEHFSRGFGAAMSGYLFGAWPGADVLLPEQANQATNEDSPPTATEAHALVDALAGSLRPASSEEWRAFLATAKTPVDDDRLLTAPTLADIGTSEAATTSATPTTPTTSTTTTPTTTTTAPGATGTISEPGVSRPSDRPSKMYSSIEGLEFRFELESGVISAQRPVLGTLVARNTTDHEIALNECTTGLTQWGLVPADDPQADPTPRDVIDCYNDPVLTVPANGTARRALDPFGAGFRAQRSMRGIWALGTLPAGAYLAVVEVPGDETTVRMSIPVTVPEPPCPTSDKLAWRYLDLTSKQAERRAEADGLGYRAARIDGEDQAATLDLRCDRINVDLRNGRVTGVLRG